MPVTVQTLALGCLLWPLVVAAQTYQCKQADGKVSFQDLPCQAGTAESKLKLRVVPPSADPPPQPTPIHPELRARMNANTAAFQALQQQNDMLNAQIRATNCTTSRHNLGVLKTAAPAFHYNERGERVFVEDADRPARIARAQDQVNEYCR